MTKRLGGNKLRGECSRCGKLLKGSSVCKCKSKTYPLNFIRFITGFSIPDIEERYEKWVKEHNKTF